MQRVFYMLKCSIRSILTTKLKAFSLIEMSLVLAIMGVVAGMSLPMLIENRVTQKRAKATENSNIIITALGAYAAANHELPCPATKESGGVAGACSAANVSSCYGYVPYKSLGISKSSATDGFGHLIRYAVEPIYTDNKRFDSTDDTHNISVLDIKSETVTQSSTKGDHIAIVLVSENEAYGSTNSSHEATNIQNNLQFYAIPYSSIKENPFRHYVPWVTKNNLLTYYGKSSPIIEKTAQSNLGNDLSDDHLF